MLIRYLGFIIATLYARIARSTSTHTLNSSSILRHITIGYEPADLTEHGAPPPPERSRVGLFFSHRGLVPPKFFPQTKRVNKYIEMYD